MELSKNKKKSSKADLNDFLKGVIEEEDSYFSNYYRPKAQASDSPIDKSSDQRDKTRNKGVIKHEQRANKPVTDFIEEPTTASKTRNKELTAAAETRNEKVIKPKQRTNKPVTGFDELSFDKVSSFQRRILEIIFEEIQTNPFEKETRPLNIQQLGALLGIVGAKGFESLRIVILRLERTGYLFKTKVKTGRSGWTQYGLPNPVFEQLLRLSQIRKPVIKDEQSTNKPVTKPVMDDSSKLVSNINTNLLTRSDPSNSDPVDDPFVEFSSDWGGLETHVAKLLVFGVTSSQIGHLRNQKVRLYGYEIITLIDRFEIWAKDPKASAGISSKAGFFVSECRKKAQDPNRSCFLDTVELPHEKAQREQTKAFIEEKRRLESVVAEITVREETSELEAVVESNGGWEAVLDLVPHGMVPKGSGAHRALVRQYFRDLKRGEN